MEGLRRFDPGLLEPSHLYQWVFCPNKKRPETSKLEWSFGGSNPQLRDPKVYHGRGIREAKLTYLLVTLETKSGRGTGLVLQKMPLSGWGDIFLQWCKQPHLSSDTLKTQRTRQEEGIEWD